MVMSPRPARSASATTSVIRPHAAAPPLAPRDRPGGRFDRLRGRLGSPALQGLLALGLYLAVWLPTLARSLVLHPTWAQLDQQNPDPNFYVWGMRWWPYAIAHGINPLFSTQIAAPAGHALAWVTTAPPLVLLAAPLTLTAGPLVAFNLVTAAALPISAWAAFVLCRRLTGRFWPSIVGGAVYGFSAFEMGHNFAGQINLSYSLLLPILAYLVLRWRDQSISSRTFVILAGLTMALQFYLFMEIFADMTALLVVGLVLGIALAGRDNRPALLRLAWLTAFAYAIALVLAVPYLAYALRTVRPRPATIPAQDLAGLVIPTRASTYGISWLTHAAATPHGVSGAGYIGIPLLVLAVLLAVTGWRSRLVRFLSCMLVLIIVASLGPELYLEGHVVRKLPWARLWYLPFVRNAFPARLMLFAFLVLAVATALWLARPASPMLWARWSLGVLVIVGLVLGSSPLAVTRQSTVPPFITAGQYRSQLAPGEIVVVVSGVGNAGMLWQAESGFYMRIAGGFINRGLTRRTDLPRPVQNLAYATPASVARFERYIKRAHVGAILVDNRYTRRWAGIFRLVGLVGHATGDVTVYPTYGCSACRRLDRAELRKGRAAARPGGQPSQPRSTSG
jgi:hypothetical protein